MRVPTPFREPARWLETGSDASSELRAAVAAEAAPRLDDARRLARVEARLEALLAGAFAPSTPPEPAAGSASGAPFSNGAASSSVGVGAKVGFLVLLGTTAVVVAASALAPGTTDARARAALPRLGSVRTLVVSPAPLPSPESPPFSTGPSRTSSPSAAVAQSPAARVEASFEMPSTPGASVAEEARLLRAARSDAGRSPERALSLLTEHERRFPRGVLADERELFAIEILARLGRTEQASARLERLRRTSPRSTYLGAAERMVGTEGRGE